MFSIKNTLIILLVIINITLIVLLFTNKQQENFTTGDDINNLITEELDKRFNGMGEAFKYMGTIAKDIVNGKDVTIPGNVHIEGNLTVDNYSRFIKRARFDDYIQLPEDKEIKFGDNAHIHYNDNTIEIDADNINITGKLNVKENLELEPDNYILWKSGSNSNTPYIKGENNGKMYINNGDSVHGYSSEPVTMNITRTNGLTLINKSSLIKEFSSLSEGTLKYHWNPLDPMDIVTEGVISFDSPDGSKFIIQTR